jgi:hypothetical protein
MRPIVLGILLIANAAAATTAATPAVAAPPRCHTNELSASLGRVDAGAGQRFTRLTLRNRANHTCRTQGWVGLRLVRNHGQPIPTRDVRVQGPSHRVVLAPGDRAATKLRWGAIPGPGEPQTGPCEPTAQHLRVTPPDETASLRLRWTSGPVCQSGRIEVTPLRHR